MKPSGRKEYRQRRHMRLRQRLAGTPGRPRMSVFVSNKHMYVQFIDDAASQTLAAVSTQSKELGERVTLTAAQAAKLGELAAKTALDKGIKQVVFDRGGFAFHGRVKALADAARAAGLQF